MEIQNVVCCGEFSCMLDLEKLVKVFHIPMNPKFPGLTIRHPAKVTAVLFGTGKFICLGAKSYEIVQLVMKDVCHNIRKAGFAQASIKKCSVTNVVASGDIGFTINLEKLWMQNSENAMLERELFPGLHLTTKNGLFVIFHSGKFYVTGVKDITKLDSLWEFIVPILCASKSVQ